LSDGSINIIASGGTPGYTFSWSNGSSSSTLLGLPSGTYTVTATDANGCQTANSYILSQPAAPLAAQQVSTSQVSCFGGVDGSIDVSVSGGTQPYTYLWSNGSTIEDLQSLSSGIYHLTVTDFNGCNTSLTASISQPAASLSVNLSVIQNVSCNGAADGQLAANPSGGTAPYVYNWSTGVASSSISGLSAGTYQVTITDNNGCVTNASASISQPVAPLNIQSSVVSNISCFNGNNGAINLTVNGGTAPYTYLWNTGATSMDIANQPAGTYTVTATDANGCTQQNTAVISQPVGSLSASLNVSQNVACFGQGTGSLDLSVTGGTAPYNFVWSNGASTEDVANLSVGAYTVTITDANGCVLNDSFVISQPAAPLSAAANALVPVSCNGGNDGSINLDVSGGTAPYVYVWSNGESTEDLVNLQSGSYTCNITDANGCTQSITVSITQPIAAIASSAIVNQQVNCFSGSDGSIDLNVSGGTAPYSYLWNNGAVTEDLSNLSAGTYSVNIIDANGCQDSVSVTVSQPQAPLTLAASGVSAANCFGTATGVIDLTVNGGTGPYNYSWSNGAVSEDLSGLSAGTYSVTVLDANGCQDTLSVIIDQPQASLSVNASSISNVDCFGNASGSIDLNVGGGTQPYTYQWNNGSSSEDLSGLISGSYTVSVVDANGCDGTLTINIQQPSNPLTSAAVVTQQVNCLNGSDGSIDLSVNGGTSPYSYVWNNGSTNQDLTNLIAGTYVVNIIDANGCLDSVSITVTQPQDSLAANAIATANVDCFGNASGSIDLDVIGGTAPYSYSWSNGSVSQDLIGIITGLYAVTVVDVNGCEDTLSIFIDQPLAPLAANVLSSSNVDCFGNATGSIDLSVNGGTQPYTYLWSNGSSNEDLSGLTSGSYTVTVTDANGCETNVTASIQQPQNPLASAAIVTQQVNCYNGSDGSIDLSVNGGTSPYGYAWSNGATTEDLTNLAAGTYTVNIIDANGCVDSVSVVVSQPLDSLSSNASVTQQVSCFGGNDGSINLSINGGTAPYGFAWSNGAVTEDVSGLAAGTYTVDITDANGCTTSQVVIIQEPSQPLSLQQNTSVQVSCFGGNDGSIDITVFGGTAPYDFQWSNGVITEDIAGLSTGSYTVTITDANGCTLSQSFLINQPSTPLAVSGTTLVGDCINNIGGDINLIVGGGTAPYTFNWSNGATTQNLNNLPSASYSVTVTDANGCIDSANFVTANNSFIYVQITDPEICVGDSALLEVTVNVPSTYQWYYNNTPILGAINDFYFAAVQGFYKCEVNSVCGIIMSDSVEVAVRSVIGATISSNQIICPPDGVELVASGGVSYQWSPTTYLTDPNASNPVANPRETTTYSVLVTDDFGCTITMSVDVTVICDTLLIPNGFSPNGDGVNDGYEIEGIDNFPGNILYIYNRWGNLIYKSKDYQNNWTGECNVSGVNYGQKVPAGTYYYILDLNDGQKPRNGFLILRK
ncbi:MAG: gliding motility-associated C-terminal domain-containing protein, partial [Bacteroidota bacterium]